MIIRPNEKICVFRVTRDYLNLLVKPRFFSGFMERNIILCILIRLSKCLKLYIFPKKFKFIHFQRHFTFQNAKNYIFFF